MRVLIVDDSVVFRSQIKQSLAGIEGLEVVGTAANGKIALDRLQDVPCDVVILDLEMPEMNGFEFLAELKTRKLPPKVIVFAAPDPSGAKNVFEAFRAGAVDFITKPQGGGDLDSSLRSIREQLVPKIKQFHERRVRGVEAVKASPIKVMVSESPGPSASVSIPSYHRVAIETFRPGVVLIGCSTGGPGVLDQLFAALKGASVSVPILIAQHMPALFTESLARRLAAVSGLPVAEGKAGERIERGKVYVAPGDFHMSVGPADGGTGTGAVIKIDQGPKRHNVRPSVDTLFESAANVYGQSCAAFILTGMGEDGKQGCIAVKQKAGAVMIQDRESSVVWGMPGAVHASGAFDREGSVVECAGVLAKLVG